MRPRQLLGAAAARLAAAGVGSPDHDAAVLLAHVLGVPRGRLAMVREVGEPEIAAYDALLAQRAARVPLQHLTGVVGFRHVDLAEIGRAHV